MDKRGHQIHSKKKTKGEKKYIPSDSQKMEKNLSMVDPPYLHCFLCGWPPYSAHASKPPLKSATV